MQAALAPHGDARTFLTHLVGGGLDDDRYVVQRYYAGMVAGMSRPTPVLSITLRQREALEAVTQRPTSAQREHHARRSC